MSALDPTRILVKMAEKLCEQVLGGFNIQKMVLNGVLSQITGFIPVIQSAWIGGDEKSFEVAVNSKLIPSMSNLIGSVGGMSMNITGAMDAVKTADKACTGYVGSWTGKVVKIIAF